MKVSGREPQAKGEAGHPAGSLVSADGHRRPSRPVLPESAAHGKPAAGGYTRAGSVSAQAMKEAEQALADSQTATTSCMFCGWKHKGPAGEGRDLARAHREKKHPEACTIKPRLRRRLRKRSLRSAEEEAQIAVDTAEARRLRSQREQDEMLAKIERGRERDRAAALALDGAV